MTFWPLRLSDWVWRALFWSIFRTAFSALFSKQKWIKIQSEKVDQNRKVLTRKWIKIVRETSRFNTGLGSVDQKVGRLRYESGLKMTSFRCVWRYLLHFLFCHWVNHFPSVRWQYFLILHSLRPAEHFLTLRTHWTIFPVRRILRSVSSLLSRLQFSIPSNKKYILIFYFSPLLPKISTFFKISTFLNVFFSKLRKTLRDLSVSFSQSFFYSLGLRVQPRNKSLTSG